MPPAGAAICGSVEGPRRPAGLSRGRNRPRRVVTARDPSSPGHSGIMGLDFRVKTRTSFPLLRKALYYTPTSCDFRRIQLREILWWRPTRETRLFGVRWREGDSPEIIGQIVLIDELDCIAGNALEGGQLRDDTGRNLSATIISHEDDRTNQQLAI